MDLKNRTQLFAISVIRLIETLPNSMTLKILKNQIVRSATSVGANYRAAKRAKSTADFINKLKIVEEELDETMYWFELFQQMIPDRKPEFQPIYLEANELLAITVSTIKKVRTQKE